jgi:hypothetical protein
VFWRLAGRKLGQKGGKSRENGSFSRISEGMFGTFWAYFYTFYIYNVSLSGQLAAASNSYLKKVEK